MSIVFLLRGVMTCKDRWNERFFIHVDLKIGVEFIPNDLKGSSLLKPQIIVSIESFCRKYKKVVGLLCKLQSGP